MPYPSPTPETPEEFRDFEQILKRLLQPPKPKPGHTLDRRTAPRPRAKKARRQVSSPA